MWAAFSKAPNPLTCRSYSQALNEALAQEMRRDPTVVVIGEDVAGGAATEGQREPYGGVLGVAKGLFAEFGEARVIDTPITESAIKVRVSRGSRI
jgi:pyruvate dehydrogenase E1 component beta subunit